MPQGSRKSRTLRRVFVKTPGARTIIQYRKRPPQKAHCSSCGAVLAGVMSARPHVMQNTPKTQKRPSRPFGGVLCSKCMRLNMKQKARALP